MNVIRSRLREPSTWLAVAFLVYLLGGAGDGADLGTLVAWGKAHRDEIAGALGALGVVLGEKGG